MPNAITYGLKTLLRPHGKVAFLARLSSGAAVLDVGCGSNSPARAKNQRPDIIYTGLDVGDYNHTTPPGLHADRYIVVPPDGFAAEIEALNSQFDAVISSHNLEHCQEPERVLAAIAAALKPGGRLYLSFPAEESVNFPRREGTLNFHDDPTHDHLPRYRDVLASLAAHGLRVEFSSKRHRPPLLFLLGLVLEPVSMLTGRTMPLLSTWALYGFESVFWSTRVAELPPDPTA
jgi:SAM-dependent methyltransferase